MQPISILGPGAAGLAATLADRLPGRVAVVRQIEQTADSTDSGGEPAAVGDTTVDLSPDGSWVGRGAASNVDSLLDRFAPDHDYVVVVGDSRLRLPTVFLGSDADPADTPGDVVTQAPTPADVDVSELIAALDGAEPWVTREELVACVERSAAADRSGAIATFTGRVRARDDPDDDRTTHLAFEKYEGVARDRMDAIAAELTDREGVFEVAMHHRTGVVEAGEDIVFVVVLAGHRAEAFRAVEDGIDRLKDEVPIFKKETTETEAFWLHQRE
jgi:molybdopterin synthase catalytic subunit